MSSAFPGLRLSVLGNLNLKLRLKHPDLVSASLDTQLYVPIEIKNA
jgi:hypothetical protein